MKLLIHDISLIDVTMVWMSYNIQQYNYLFQKGYEW